ncbi:MAG: hypothetical protein EOO04_36305, partial [Chitinophagaceae bacterium]
MNILRHALTALLLLVFYSQVQAQLTHLGEDLRVSGNGYTKNDVVTEENRYSRRHFASGLAFLQGKYYFATPNSRLYETDGTLSG